MSRQTILLSHFMLMVLLAFLSSSLAFAQEEKPQARSLPGFEELFTAGELLESSKEFQEAQQDGATLTQKRIALESKAVTNALRLLRAWLDKPGREGKPGLLVDAPLANLRHFRLLGRALGIEQYVALSTGRVADTIDSARDGFRLSYILKPNQYVVWLYGAAIDSAMAMNLGKHVRQFSRRDCDRLTTLANDWLKSPDFASVALEVERNVVQRNYQRQIAQIMRLTEDPKGVPPDTGDESDSPLPPELAKLSPAEIKEAYKNTPMHLDALFVRLQADLKKPYWELTPPAPPAAPTSLSERLAQPFVQSLEAPMRSMLLTRTRQQAYARMLACHAAILRYRWEHDRLPASLEELQIGDTAIDPFSGQPLVYKVKEREYTLDSIGPEARDTDGNNITGQRVPISLTPRPKIE